MPEALCSIDDIRQNLKAQLQALYADKSIIEDKIFELKSQLTGFETCLSLQAQIAEAEAALEAEKASVAKALAKAAAKANRKK